MCVLWGSLAGLLLYLEILYHFWGFGWSSYHPVFTIGLIVVWSTVITVLVGLIRGRWKKLVYYTFVWLAIVWSCAQYVYLFIFKQPLLWEAIFRGGGDALTNYWREGLAGMLGSSPFLLLTMLPGVIIGTALHVSKWKFPDFGQLHILRLSVVLVTGIAIETVTLVVGKSLQLDYYEEYAEFYDPLSVAEEMGFLPMLQRDTIHGLVQFVEQVWGIGTDKMQTVMENKEAQYDAVMGINPKADANKDEEGNTESGSDAGEETDSDVREENKTEEEDGTEQEVIIRPQQFSVDFTTLRALADNEKQKWLADYIEGLQPTMTNEYTGLFEGYNLIYLTAEGFSTYAIREDLTPTLYRLANSGFVFENYYVPLWQTSTSDGEYINCTGLIPDGQFSMRKSSSNDMAYTLPKFFAAEGVKSYAYHDNSLSYYDRYVTHPNLGYDFKSSSLGKLSKAEWGDKIFPMEHPDAWPASDLEMMQGTTSEYLTQERFHVYYMTVSGHMNYDFKGNAMSSKNRDAVSKLEMSENAKAYLACNIELDKALEYLLDCLEEAGQLEKTVICMSADHYPYSMSQEQYEELAGKSLSEGMDMYRNTLILWNAGMEEKPVHVQKVCGSMDILPTLLNLFGFPYDSRMYAGRDIFSDEEGMVIFKDRSFVTDSVIYKRKGKKTTWIQNAEGEDIIAEDQKENYLADKQQETKDRYQFSAYILQENYYQDVEQAIAGVSETIDSP